MSNSLQLHHIGYVVKDAEAFIKMYPVNTFVKKVYDIIQDAELSLYDIGSNIFLELIVPKSSSSFTYKSSLEQNFIVVHHHCYSVKCEEAMYEIAKEYRLIKIRGPLQAILFNNKNVYFFLTRNKQLIEFLIDA